MEDTSKPLMLQDELNEWYIKTISRIRLEKSNAQAQKTSKSSINPMHYIGPAFLIAMACLDPGNLSGDIAVGQKTGYRLLWLLVVSGFLCYYYQSLALTVGTFSRKDISQLCKIYYPINWNISIWLMAEIALLASDTQEVLGTAISLKILFGIEIHYGVVISLILVFLMLYAQNKGQQFFEKIFAVFITIMGVCFFYNFFHIEKDWVGIAFGFIPRMQKNDLGYAISLLGSIIMPQNLFLHSTLVNTRKINVNSKYSWFMHFVYSYLRSGIHCEGTVHKSNFWGDSIPK